MVAENEVYGIFMVCNEVHDLCILNATVYYIADKDELSVFSSQLDATSASMSFLKSP